MRHTITQHGKTTHVDSGKPQGLRRSRVSRAGDWERKRAYVGEFPADATRVLRIVKNTRRLERLTAAVRRYAGRRAIEHGILDDSVQTTLLLIARYRMTFSKAIREAVRQCWREVKQHGHIAQVASLDAYWRENDITEHDALLIRTKGKQQSTVVRMLKEGYTRSEIAEHLTVTPARITHLIDEIRELNA